MDLAAVFAVCRCLTRHGIAFWVDGGWGVDALLGIQTRPHADLDLAVYLTDLADCGDALAILGYERATTPDNPDWNPVLRGPTGVVDLHGFTIDTYGNGILGDPADGAMYPAGSLKGVGRLSGEKVCCIAAEYVLQFRGSFEPREVDRQDVAALCERFGLALPRRFLTGES